MKLQLCSMSLTKTCLSGLPPSVKSEPLCEHRPDACILLAFGHHLMVSHYFTDKEEKGLPDVVW